MFDTQSQNPQGRPRGRPWAKGQSGNSAGRPAGCRNKATRAAELYLDGEAEAALAMIPVTRELQRADHGYDAGAPECGGGALDAFVAETRRLATRYAADCEIDLATAALAHLFAWGLARRSIELQPSGKNLPLISCNGWGGLSNATPTDADLSRKTTGFAPLNRFTKPAREQSAAYTKSR